MTYEVMHGDNTHFIQAGNPWAACLGALRDESEADNIQQAVFQVNLLHMGETQTITMQEVLSLQILAANPEEETTYEDEAAPHMDLTRW